MSAIIQNLQSLQQTFDVIVTGYIKGENMLLSFEHFRYQWQYDTEFLQYINLGTYKQLCQDKIQSKVSKVTDQKISETKYENKLLMPALGLDSLVSKYSILYKKVPRLDTQSYSKHSYTKGLFVVFERSVWYQCCTANSGLRNKLSVSSNQLNLSVHAWPLNSLAQRSK